MTGAIRADHAYRVSPIGRADYAGLARHGTSRTSGGPERDYDANSDATEVMGEEVDPEDLALTLGLRLGRNNSKKD